MISQDGVPESEDGGDSTTPFAFATATTAVCAARAWSSRLPELGFVAARACFARGVAPGPKTPNPFGIATSSVPW